MQLHFFLVKRPTFVISLLYIFSPSHLYSSTLRSVLAWIMTCQCFRSSAMSVVVWFLVISSFTRSRHLSFGLPRFRFPSTVICNMALVASYLPRTCPNHLNLFSLRNSAIGARAHVCLFPDVYICHIHLVLSFVLPTPHQNAQYSCVHIPLLLSNCPPLCSIHHGRFRSRIVHFGFRL